ncbi:MAG TPA: hypothetical protein VE267_04375 [Bradyrhizobium sp.]|nr:hypothetical protein [Bradyrhizobium sp.]
MSVVPVHGIRTSVSTKPFLTRFRVGFHNWKYSSSSTGNIRQPEVIVIEISSKEGNDIREPEEPARQKQQGSEAMVRHRTLLCTAVSILAAAIFSTDAISGEGDGRDGAVRLLTTVPIPGTAANTSSGNMYVFDISFVDQTTQTYYLADRSNAAVDVVDARTNQLISQIKGTPAFMGFTGNNGTSGPNGVVAAFPWLFVTDANSRVASIDLRTGKTVSNVSTGGASGLRADELAYDPNDGLLLVVNNADTPPFATLISANPTTGALVVGKRITFDAAHTGVDATNGAEQPVWEPVTGKFYLSIPQTGPNAKDGAVVRINTAGTVEVQYPIQFCSPAGLTVGPNVDLLVGCNTVFDTAGNLWDATKNVTAAPIQVILDARTGKIDTMVPGVGVGDEVWFNSGDGNYYTASSTSPLRPLEAIPATPLTAQGAAILGVINAKDHTLKQLVPTFNVPAVTGPSAHPAGTAHSVAANARNNHVFVPLPANNVFPNCLTGCIGVYGTSPRFDETAER